MTYILIAIGIYVLIGVLLFILFVSSDEWGFLLLHIPFALFTIFGWLPFWIISGMRKLSEIHKNRKKENE